MAHRSATHLISIPYLDPSSRIPELRLQSPNQRAEEHPARPRRKAQQKPGEGPRGLQRARNRRDSSQAKPAGRRGPGGNEEVTRPRPGGKPRNLSMGLSPEAPKPGPTPVPALFPGPGTSAAPPPRSPHPGSRSRRGRGFASRGSGAEPEREPTPQRAGAGRALRACPRRRAGLRPHLRGILVRPVPPPPPSARPGVLARYRGLGAALCASGSRSRLRGSARLCPPGCPAPSICTCRAAALWALGAAHPPPRGRGPPGSPPASHPAWASGRTRFAEATGEMPGPAQLAFADGRNDGSLEDWWPLVH